MQTNLSRRAFLLGATAAGIGLVTPSFAIADTTEATNNEPRFSFSLSTIDSNGNAIPAANQFQNYSPEYSIIELGGIYRKEQRSNSRFLRNRLSEAQFIDRRSTFYGRKLRRSARTTGS